MKRNAELLFPDILGNDILKRRIAADIESDSYFHSVMLTGPDGCGKKMFACRIAAALSCERSEDHTSPLPCGECDSCKKIFAGLSPDVIYIGRDNHDTLGVETVRDVKGDVLITSNDLDKKVYIIDDVHTMTPQAQNAALKLLEEPPKNVFFILLAADTQNVLETILSRVIIFRVEPISDVMLEKYLSDKLSGFQTGDIGADKLKEIVRCSHGSVGKGLDLLSAKPSERDALLEVYRLPGRLIHSLACERDLKAYTELSRELPEERTALAEFFDDIAVAARDIISAKVGGASEPLYYLSDAEVDETAGRITLRRAYRIAETAFSMSDICRRNVNLQLISGKFVFELRRIFNS